LRNRAVQPEELITIQERLLVSDILATAIEWNDKMHRFVYCLNICIFQYQRKRTPRTTHASQRTKEKSENLVKTTKISLNTSAAVGHSVSNQPNFRKSHAFASQIERLLFPVMKKRDGYFFRMMNIRHGMGQLPDSLTSRLLTKLG